MISPSLPRGRILFSVYNVGMKNIGFSPADVLLPKKGIDLEKWAVVACDQYTSERDYWEKADSFVASSPSTLRMILPECYLEDDDKEERIRKADETMNEYLESDVFTLYPDSFILVKRDTESGTRYGLVGKLDLEEYDYSPDSLSPIRATEGTILSRIPPRKEIRKNAPLEIPHIMVLISDEKRSVIEPLSERRSELEKIYDSPLMLGGGHIEGYLVSKEEDKECIYKALEELEKELDKSNPLLYAMGDGNHSLASAKSLWEDVKKTLSDDERKDHPMRYALCEIENIFDDGLMFEPIHRVFFGLKSESFEDALRKHSSSFRKWKAESFEKAWNEINEKPGRFMADDGTGLVVYEAEGTEKSLSAWTIQSVIDTLLSEDACKVDYIHGAKETLSLAGNGNIAVILPDIHKETFFSAILHDKAYPRKTFSIGHAEEKRYYMEARKIIR